MLFWAGILVGGLFAWFAIKMGFYETWVMVFNTVISIYLAVFLRPVVADIVPAAAGNTPYSNALTVLVIAAASFLILHGISYVFFTSQFSVSFPKIFDILGTGLLGFLGGFLVWSFAALLIYTTPVSENSFVKEIGFGEEFKQDNISYISWWCNLVDKVASHRDNEYTVEQAISGLLTTNFKKKTRVRKPKPAEPAEPNKAETSVIEVNELGPPPDTDIEDI